MKLTLCLLCLTVAVTPLTAAPASNPDIPHIAAQAATYQSGDSAEPLRQIEELIRQSQNQRSVRAQLEVELIKLLAPSATAEARRFACVQLAAIGSERALPAIAELLKHDDTVTFACFALATHPSGKANQILRDALSSARGIARVQIIAALGDRRDAKAVPALAAIVRENQAAPMRAAITALGKIGNAGARKELAALRKTTAPELERWFTEADLRIAEKLAAAGDRKGAAAIYESHIAPSQPAFVRRGAFIALTRLDRDGGEQRILTTLRGSDAVLRPVAIASVRSLPARNASETFARELPGLAPEEQVWLIDSLAARNDAPARAALGASLGSANGGVRLAAAAALGRIGDASAVRFFANAIAAAKDADEARALESALGAMPPNRETDQAIMAEVKQARGETRARLISALATRPSSEATALLFVETENVDPIVVRAAYRVLARAGTGEELLRLVKKFATIRNAELRSDVAGFVEQAVGGTDSVSLRTTAVKSALDQARDVETRCALVALLPACSGKNALDLLKISVSEPEASTRDAALRALAEWPDTAAWEVLEKLCREPANDANRAVALRGLVRLADESNAKPDATLIGRYRELLAKARNDDERKLVLGALGGAAHPEALSLAVAHLDSGGVRAEAEAAVKKIAKAIEKKNPEAAKVALERIAK